MLASLTDFTSTNFIKGIFVTDRYRVYYHKQGGGSRYQKNVINFDKNMWSYTLSSVTGSGHVKYMASPLFYFYMTTCYAL